MATPDDINSTLQGIARNLGQWVQAFNARNVSGTFTLSAATTTVVSQPAVTATSEISLTETNGTAALTRRTAGVFVPVSGIVPGTSFSVSTQTGAALGTETFSYLIFNPS